MNPSTRLSCSTALAAFALSFLATPEAGALVAPTCGNGPACPMGYTCETFPTSCPTIDCIDGEECPPCEPADEQYCVPGPCSSDADCAADMKCQVYEYETCDGGEGTPGCAPDGECSDPVPDAEGERAAAPMDLPATSCTTETTSQCMPRWQLPCEAAADCGEGFECVALERCSCSGSGGMPLPTEPDGGNGESSGGSSGSGESDPAKPADSDTEFAAPPPEGDPLPSDCVCEPSDQKMCQANQTACSEDADCATGWTCRENPEGVCWSDADGNMGCEPADPAMLCMPPYTDLYGYPVGVPEDGGGTPTRGEPGSEDGESNDSSGLSNDGDSGSADSGGCTLSAPSGSRSTLGLALFGALFAFGLGRRRARRS